MQVRECNQNARRINAGVGLCALAWSYGRIILGYVDVHKYDAMCQIFCLPVTLTVAKMEVYCDPGSTPYLRLSGDYVIH